jgi:hypothetical protein
MRRPLLALSASAGAIALVVMSVAPASAAELPTSDVLYVLPDSFYSSTSTGASTYIADLPSGGKYGADFDVTTGLGFFFTDGSPCTLYSIVPETGVYTEIGPVGDTGMDECDALNVASDGTLRIADQDGVMLTVDKATGATLSSVTVTGPDSISFIDQSSTGQFYVGTYGGDLYTLDVETGATVFIAAPTDYIETASFDSTDTLWISGSGDSCQGLSSLSLSDPVGTFQFQGDFLDGEDCLSAYSMFISGAAQPVPAKLADTGSVMPGWLLPFAVLGLIAGAGALVVARRTRQA